MTEINRKRRINYRIFLAIIIILILGFIIARWIFPKESPLLTYDDPIFEQMLESQYRVLPNGFIMAGMHYTEEDAKKLKGIKLFFKYDENSDLRDLDKFPNLKAINIVHATEEMLKKISELDNVESLQIVPSNAKTDTSVIKNMKNLKCLIILGGTHQQWEFIKGMPQLETLSIKNVNMENLNHISNLHNLTRLTIDECKVSDLSGLGNLTQLEHLGLGSIEGMDYGETYQSIKNLKKLKQLYLTECPGIKKLNFLTPLTELSMISLREIGTTDLSVLYDLSRYPKLGTLLLGDDIKTQHSPDVDRLLQEVEARNMGVLYGDFYDRARSREPFIE